MLKTELAKGGVSELQNGGRPTRHQPGNGYQSGHPSSPASGMSRLTHSAQPSRSLRATQPSRPSTPGLNSTAQAAHVINIDNPVPKYFEVCINAGAHAVGHYELDISESTSDGALFVKIWEKYKMSKGFGLRRFFLRPRDVHFVMVIISLDPRKNFYLANSKIVLY